MIINVIDALKFPLVPTLTLYCECMLEKLHKFIAPSCDTYMHTSTFSVIWSHIDKKLAQVIEKASEIIC